MRLTTTKRVVTRSFRFLLLKITSYFIYYTKKSTHLCLITHKTAAVCLWLRETHKSSKSIKKKTNHYRNICIQQQYWKKNFPCRFRLIEYKQTPEWLCKSAFDKFQVNWLLIDRRVRFQCKKNYCSLQLQYNNLDKAPRSRRSVSPIMISLGVRCGDLVGRLSASIIVICHIEAIKKQRSMLECFCLEKEPPTLLYCFNFSRDFIILWIGERMEIKTNDWWPARHTRMLRVIITSLHRPWGWRIIMEIESS